MVNDTQITAGYIRADRYNSRARQLAALIAAGAPADRIYVEGERSETLADAIRAVDPGEALAMVGLDRMGSRAAIVQALDRMRADQLRVYDVATAVLVDPASAYSVARALQMIDGARRMPSPEIAAERGRKGAPKSGWIGLSPEARTQMQALWSGSDLTQAAVAEAFGISLRTAQRWQRLGYLKPR